MTVSESVGTVGPRRQKRLARAIANTEEADGDEPEEIQIEEERDADVEPIRSAPDPGQPTAKQLEEHRKTHLPFRCWCKWCVLGRGRGLQHSKGVWSMIAIVGVDYFFITDAGVFTRKELLKQYEDLQQG